MPYGTIKVDNITFDNGGTDKLLTVSGLFFSTSGALTVTGTISGGNVTAPTATFTTLTGTTTAGTTATFASGSFTSLTGVTTTVTSGIFGLGSAAAPSIAFSGDTNNGIYSPGADQVGISTNGTSRIVVDNSGRLLVSTISGTSVGITVGSQYGGINLPGGGGSWANWGGSYGMFPYAGVGLGIATGAAINFVNGAGADIASINGTTGVYTPLSDSRKKKDFEDSSIGLAEVLQLKPKLYRMLEDANDAPKELGFIAQEVKLLIPQAYVENKITDEATFIGVQDRPIVAALVKGMQEQQAIITALETRLSALEAA
jgi:hypothetical protein